MLCLRLYVVGAAVAAFALLTLCGCGGKGGRVFPLYNSDVGRAVDTDGDYISDWVELQLGTDPENIDSDLDGQTDYYELFASQNLLGAVTGMPDVLPDQNNNGVHAALDSDDNGDGLYDGSSDSDEDGVTNVLELHGYYWESVTGRFLQWDGRRLDINYYKTNPNQWSTDADPYGDGMEASGVNMDQRVPFPGNHPLIPAYPDLYCVMEGYGVTVVADIQTTNSKELSHTWNQQVVDHKESVTDYNRTLDVDTQAGYDKGKVSAGIKVKGHIGKDTKTTRSHTVTTNESNFSKEEWSEAVSTKTDQAAAITLNLRFFNLGTAPADNVSPTVSLALDRFTITSGIGLSAPIELLDNDENKPYPPAGQTPVGINQDSRGNPIYLSLDQLRSFQTGARITVDVPQFGAEVFKNITDPNGQKYTANGKWADYLSAIQKNAARLIVDDGRGHTRSLLVFAPPSLPPGKREDSGAPKVTLRDALIWAFGGYDSGGIPHISIPNPDGTYADVSLEGWRFSFNMGAYTDLANSQGQSPDYTQNLFSFPLHAGDVVLGKAPPPEGEENPHLYWDAFDWDTLQMRGWADDYYAIDHVYFKPTPNTADENAMEMSITADPEDRNSFIFYGVDLDSSYVETGTETIVAVNDMARRVSLPAAFIPTAATGSVRTPTFNSSDSAAMHGNNSTWTLDLGPSPQHHQPFDVFQTGSFFVDNPYSQTGRAAHLKLRSGVKALRLNSWNLGFLATYSANYSTSMPQLLIWEGAADSSDDPIWVDRTENVGAVFAVEFTDGYRAIVQYNNWGHQPHLAGGYYFESLDWWFDFRWKLYAPPME